MKFNLTSVTPARTWILSPRGKATVLPWTFKHYPWLKVKHHESVHLCGFPPTTDHIMEYQK